MLARTQNRVKTWAYTFYNRPLFRSMTNITAGTASAITTINQATHPGKYTGSPSAAATGLTANANMTNINHAKN